MNTHSTSQGFHFEMGQLQDYQTDTIHIEHEDGDIPYYKNFFANQSKCLINDQSSIAEFIVFRSCEFWEFRK